MSRTHSLLASSSLLPALSLSLALRHHLSLVRRLLRCKVCYIIAQSVAVAGVSWHSAFCPPLPLSILNVFSSSLTPYTALVSAQHMQILYAYF